MQLPLKHYTKEIDGKIVLKSMVEIGVESQPDLKENMSKMKAQNLEALKALISNLEIVGINAGHETKM